MPKILTVTDEPGLLKLLREALERDGHTVESVDTWNGFDQRLQQFESEAVVVDVTSSTARAVEFCRNYRRVSGMAPILVLTPCTAVEELIEVLDAGADDYLTKPFQANDLIAHIRALLRRSPVIYGRFLSANHLVIDTSTSIAMQAGKRINLQPKEYNLLEFFMRHPNQVFSAEALWEHVWASSDITTMGTVRTHIKTLRKKIAGADGTSMIVTVHGKGYKFDTTACGQADAVTTQSLGKKQR